MQQRYAWKIGNGLVPACSTKWVQGECPEVQDYITLRQSASAKVSDFISFNPLCWNHLAIFRFFQHSKASHNETTLLSQGPRADKDFKFLWAMSIMRKWKFFLWKIFYIGLPLSSRLIIRQITVSDHCPLYHEEPETYQHLLRLCLLVQRLWNSSSLGIRSSTNVSTPFQLWVKEYLLLFKD
ncbi:Flavin-dependent tryptophan halogenase RebH [Bienertia sinuspersici]